MPTLRNLWNWAHDGIEGFFSLRLPWLAELEAALRSGDPVCFLVPRRAGEIDDWWPLLDEYLWDRSYDLTHASSSHVASALLDFVGSDLPRDGKGSMKDLAEHALGRFRADVGVVSPRFWSIGIGPGSSWQQLQDWLDAQQRLSVPAISPLVIGHDLPDNQAWRVVRLGAPEVVGNLQRIKVFPEQDPQRWRRLYLSLVVLWECGGTPPLANELWQELDAELPSLTHARFDDLLHDRLECFASSAMQDDSDCKPGSLAAWLKPLRIIDPPNCEETNQLWQTGRLAWHCHGFEITPLAARELLPMLELEDDRRFLRRRRLTNGHLSRWLASWATTVEFGLRLSALEAGADCFTQHLERQPPLNDRFDSRHQELMYRAGQECSSIVDLADLVDIEKFLLAEFPGRANAADLRRGRLARNDIIHQHETTAKVVLPLFRAAASLDLLGMI